EFPVMLRDFNKIFPCHICFNRQLIVEHVGFFLLNEYNLANRKGVRLQDIVELLQPTAAQMHFNSFLENANTRFIFRMKMKGRRHANRDPKPLDLVLTGQMQQLHSGTSIVFLCTPYANSVRQLLDTSHYISDIPLRDSTRDLIMLSQSRVWQLERNKSLEEACRKLPSRQKQLYTRQDKNQSLLYIHVPPQVAETLQQNRYYEPRSYAEVTVLAASMPDFPAITAYCSPADVIDMLARVTARFDRLVEIRKLYSVPSYSDAWLVVGGVPDRSRTDHTPAVLDLAIGMIAEARQIIAPHFTMPLRVSTTSFHSPVN
ncbi:hypothetical protein PFISCL1PPCAC_12645, partial [Pristionchus fissidentatus]